jgi:hypothetical protein
MADDVKEGDGFRVAEVVIDPKWQIAPLPWGDQQLIILRVHHPRHGAMDLMLSKASAIGIRDTLVRVLGEE